MLKHFLSLLLSALLGLGLALEAGADTFTKTLYFPVINKDGSSLKYANFHNPATLTIYFDNEADTASFHFNANPGYVFIGAKAINLKVNGLFDPPAPTIASSGGSAPTLTLEAGPVIVGSDIGWGSNLPTNIYNISYSSPSGTEDGTFTSAEINLTGVQANTLIGLLAGNLDALLIPNYAAVHARNDLGYIAYGSVVPLPGAILLLGAGLGRLAIYRRRKLTDMN